MQERLSNHIRCNVVGYVALFFALSGGAAWAVHPGGAGTINSADIINGEVRNDDLAANSVGTGKIADRSVKNADLSIGASSSNTIADGGIQGVDVMSNTLTGAQVNESTLFNDKSLTGVDDIQEDSITAGEIQDSFHSVNLPLGSFLDLTGRAIDFDSSSLTLSPDFTFINAGLVIEYDDDDGLEDSHGIVSTFSVPQDYSSGGSLELRVSKDLHTGGELGEEYIDCFVSVNGAGATASGLVEITTADSTAYTVTPPATYLPGNSVGVGCRAGIGGIPNDDVRIHSIEFNYRGAQ